MTSKDKREILKKLTDFCAEPLGTIESKLCDWNKPSTYALSDRTPQEAEKTILEFITKVLDSQLCDKAGKKGMPKEGK